MYGLAVARLVLLLAGRDCPASVAKAIATAIPVSETIPTTLRMRRPFSIRSAPAFYRGARRALCAWRFALDRGIPPRDNLRVRPFFLGAVLACIVAACGSDNRSQPIPSNPIAPSTPAPSPPTPSPTPARPVVIHDSLNVPGDRNILDLEKSVAVITYWSGAGLLPRMLDDFTSPVTAAIRTVSWQGAYCRKGIRADSNSFYVGFDRDKNGRPEYLGTLYFVTLTPAEMKEQFAFEIAGRDESCYYYDYTAVLPTPFPVTAGSRYWLQIVARRDDTNWSWRAGQPDNGIAALESRSVFFMLTKDLAFSLSGDSAD